MGIKTGAGQAVGHVIASIPGGFGDLGFRDFQGAIIQGTGQGIIYKGGCIGIVTRFWRLALFAAGS